MVSFVILGGSVYEITFDVLSRLRICGFPMELPPRMLRVKGSALTSVIVSLLLFFPRSVNLLFDAKTCCQSSNDYRCLTFVFFYGASQKQQLKTYVSSTWSTILTRMRRTWFLDNFAAFPWETLGTCTSILVGCSIFTSSTMHARFMCTAII